MTSLITAAEIAPAETQPMFVCSRRMMVLDHFRVPYSVDPTLAVNGVHQLRCGTAGPALIWPASVPATAEAASISGDGAAASIPVFARLAGHEFVLPVLADRGGGQAVRSIVTGAGRDGTSIWRATDGSIFVPFDPDEVVLNFWTEGYQLIALGGRSRRVRRLLVRIYYRLRPALPRPVQIWMRRRLVRLQLRHSFPRWPVETGLHDFFDLMFAMLSDLAGEPVPRIAAWPAGYDWALVLTHDVERAEGLAAVEPVLELEEAHGFRSSFNLVAGDYPVDRREVLKLSERGFEVGVHGLHHDGRDLESLDTWQARLPRIQAARDLWGAHGFRAPALHRRWDWMRLLDYAYDSSWPDTDPFEPQRGGCCTWLPFFNGELLELPMTITQDHTLFVILRRVDETTWVEKAQFLRCQGGLALLNTHPDYLVDQQIFDAYRNFLRLFEDDDRAWKALPREVNDWWRRRAASRIERVGKEWQVVGPAAGEGRVELIGGAW